MNSTCYLTVCHLSFFLSTEKASSILKVGACLFEGCNYCLLYIYFYDLKIFTRKNPKTFVVNPTNEKMKPRNILSQFCQHSKILFFFHVFMIIIHSLISYRAADTKKFQKGESEAGNSYKKNALLKRKMVCSPKKVR